MIKKGIDLTMKRVLKFITLSFVIAVMCICSVMPSFAASKSLVINGEKKVKLSKGDVVTYELMLGDCKDKVEGLQAYIFYDDDYLKIDGDSVKFPSLSSVVSNSGLEGTLTFNWTDVSNTVSFKKTKTLVSADFKVLKAGETDITYFISELYGDDMTYLKNYTFTYNLYVNGDLAVEGETPLVDENEENLNQYQGSFINYADGKGEQNGAGDSDDDDRVAVTGETNKSTSATVVTKDSSNTSLVTIITVASIVLVIIAIIVVIILRNVFSKKEENSDGETEQDAEQAENDDDSALQQDEEAIDKSEEESTQADDKDSDEE